MGTLNIGHENKMFYFVSRKGTKKIKCEIFNKCK